MTEELFRDDPYLRSCDAAVTAAGDGAVVLDRTVFYATGGGQPGDHGLLRTEDGREIRIVDCVKARDDGRHLHLVGDGEQAPAVGERVRAEIDWPRRHRLMRTHTALHVLCAVVSGAVTGSAVGEGRGRLDFDIPEPTLDKQRIEDEMNRIIAENRPVRIAWISEAELAASPDLVRTLSVKPPVGEGVGQGAGEGAGEGRVRVIEIEGTDLQPCGGTHVRASGEIGPVRIGKIEKKGRHNRRVNVLLDG